MKKILLLAISLPMSLSAMTEYFNYWPVYLNLQTPPTYINRETGKPYSAIVNCHLARIFENTNKLRKKYLAPVENERKRNGCHLKDVYQETTGNTLLHAVVLRNGDPGVVAYLLEQGVDPSLQNINGKRALDIAVELSYEDLIAALAAATSNMVPPQIEDVVDHSSNDGVERENEKKGSWLDYVTIERSILAAVGIFAARYAWQQYTAKEKTTG